MLKIKKLISSFYFMWFTVVSISICAAIFLARPLGEYLYKNNGMSYSASNDGYFEGILSLILLLGLFMGFGQWIVVNTKIKKAYSWVLATLVGFSIGIFISLWFFALVLPITGMRYKVSGWIELVGTFAGAGMFTGFCQWVSLKRKITGSRKWSLVTGMSFTIGFLPIFLLSDYQMEHPIFKIISIIISAGLIASISGYFAESTIINPEIEKFIPQESAI